MPGGEAETKGFSVWAALGIPILRRLMQVDLWDFEVNLASTDQSGRATVKKKKKKVTRNNAYMDSGIHTQVHL